MRATTIRTNSNISVIVPNTEFVTSTVINWSHDDRNVRVLIPVGVSYKEDPARIREILLDVVKQEPGVLAHPEPAVLFDTYGDSALNFNLSVWTQQFMSTPALLKSRLYFAIFDRFRTEGVEIPFPQQDVHIIDTPESRQGEHS
ncbi:MAG TPA: mechanosensitive ion channel [Treponemataceae bacterium]|nr:mechanosensitive ion channel [Treponemataceae bacterium]